VKILLSVCAVCVGSIALLCCIASRERSSRSPLGTALSKPWEGAAVLDEIEAVAARAETGTSVSQASDELRFDDDLIERLRALGRARAEGDMQAIAKHVESLLTAPTTPRRVLGFVRRGRLGPGTFEADGAVLAIAFAAASEVKRPALTLDGKPFTREFLENLGEFDLETGMPIANFAAGLQVGGRPAIGVRWLPLIAVLRDQFTEHAANFDPLVRAILSGGEVVEAAGDVAQELAMVLDTSTDPLTVKAALAILLATNAEAYLPVAEDICARSAAAPGLKSAIIEAVAGHAPVAAAAASLARIADSNAFIALLSFGARAGAADAAAREYSALLAEGTNVRGRRMLVSALSGEAEPVLIGIAETDPAPVVRQQALLTLTLRPTDSAASLATMRARHAARSDPASGMTTVAALPVAGNLVRNGSPRVRAEAIQWFKNVVLDTSESLDDRTAAWTRLVSQARPEEIVGLERPR